MALGSPWRWRNGELLAVAMAVGLSGCAMAMGAFPSVSAGDPPPFKMIRPGAHAESCQVTFPWSNRTELGSALRQIVGEFRAVDPEIDTLQNVQIDASGWNLGLVRRACVEVTADLGRTIPSVSIPMDHEHHHHHE